MSWPATTTLPELAVTMPQTMLIKVVLPAPLGPSSANISLSRISRLMFLSARRPVGEVLVRLAIDSAGSMAATLAQLRGPQDPNFLEIDRRAMIGSSGC